MAKPIKYCKVKKQQKTGHYSTVPLILSSKLGKSKPYLNISLGETTIKKSQNMMFTEGREDYVNLEGDRREEDISKAQP